MNATSFQVPASFVWSSPKHDEPWSRSPVVNAAQIVILFLAGMVPLPRLAVLSAVCCGLGFGSYGAFSDGCVSSFTLALAQSSEFEQEPLQTHTIVPLSWLPTTLTRPGSGHAILKNVHWGMCESANWQLAQIAEKTT